MKLYLLAILFIASSIGLFSQDDAYAKELRNLWDMSLMPQYRIGGMEQFSSYDTTGGNDDGFSGKYSYIRKEGSDLVVADIRGAGVINRIWTPTPSNDTIRFYFDGEKEPRIALPFIDLFSGTVFPFVAPLCGNEIGGYYCYLPIPYEKSLKITYRGDGLKFHQIQYRKLEGKDKIKSFSFDYFNRNKTILNDIKLVWNKQKTIFDTYGTKLKTQQFELTIKPGEEKDIFHYTQGGRILGVEINAGNDILQAKRNLLFSANWDNEPKNAIHVPFYDFFGYAFGKPSMTSTLLGATNTLAYSYIPMPFDKSARLSLHFQQAEGIACEKGATISGTIYYEDRKRDSHSEGKLYAQSRREYKPKVGEPYLIADVKGKGHYIGTILIAQGLEEGMTLYWEGDDRSIIDGKMKMHGTGSEDYFNGGWYAIHDRWDAGVSLPIHGALLYNLKSARTGGYRFLLADKINFNSSYNLTIEHGPEENKLDVDYTSVALFYSDKPLFTNTYLQSVSAPVKRRDILLAQDFTLRPYWFTSASQGDNSILIASKRVDHWTTNIDFEAVPMIQLDLTGLDNGRYRVQIVHHSIKDGKPFCVWQRTQPISDWIPTDNGETGQVITSDVGEIIISDQIKTITVRKKKMDDTEVDIHSFVFEKVE